MSNDCTPTKGGGVVSGWVPTTDEVRGFFSGSVLLEAGPDSFELLDYAVAGEAFDRWLAARDAEVKAEALEEFAAELDKKFPFKPKGHGSPTRDFTGKTLVALAKGRAAEYRKGENE